MKQTTEDKEFDDVFEQFSNRELLLNFRRNLEKYKGLANSANLRSNENSREINRIFMNINTELEEVRRVSAEMYRYLDLPWYKKIFYKRSKDASQ